MTSAIDTASPRRRRPIAVGESLPAMSLPRKGAPGMVSWSQGPMASVVFVPHQDCCQGCADYVALLATAADGLRDWATRPMVIAGARDTAGLGGAGELPGVVMLVDEAGAVRARLGVDEDQALVVQADRWGAVYAVESVKVTADHQAVLPTAENLVALAKFVDIQCPECGIPSKEWLGSSAFPLG